MPTKVWTKGYLSVGGTDLSAYVQRLAISIDPETADNTTMGNTTRTAAPGLSNFAVSADLLQSSSTVDATINGILGSTTTVVVGRSSTGISADNPRWTCSVACNGYSPHDGSVGDMDVARVSFVAAGDYTRATST